MQRSFWCQGAEGQRRRTAALDPSCRAVEVKRRQMRRRSLGSGRCERRQHQWEAGSDGVTGSAVEEKAGFLPRAAAGRGRAPLGDERLLVPASARMPCRPGTRPGDCYGQRLLEGTLCLNKPLPTLPRPHPLLPEEQPGRKASLGGPRARAGSDRAAEELRAVETHRRHGALPCGSAGEPLARKRFRARSRAQRKPSAGRGALYGGDRLPQSL
ncbi:hypothetical protein NDU88_005615 [Pleurodeles waltl]|uniref:Uncharacterized protein n=1 Tax=Pleurodeles waltl TaxID=8319 RepID=A0AAV7RJ30_PLEWA|nr:hypothetical protein NDU88_005615 [Pleurodeles waltl]